MRKGRLEPEITQPNARPSEGWLQLEDIATVQVSSEDPGFPVESALTGIGPGWRASEPGTQRIRLIFDQPLKISRIFLLFEELDHARTQEFTLKCQGDELVRQQWNFSPRGSTSESETCQVNRDGVTTIELSITPDISGRHHLATLKEFRVS